MTDPSTCRLAAGIGAFVGDLRAARALPGVSSGSKLPRDFRNPEDRRSRIRTGTEPSTAGRGSGRSGLSPTTTYATTYAWVSAGTRRELAAPPRSEKRLNGTKWDRTGLNRCTERLATNQKVAGSSPAERATKYLQIRRFCSVKSARRSARTTHLTTYLFETLSRAPFGASGSPRI